MGVAVAPRSTQPERGHARGESSRSDQQPRIPLIGVDAGCIPGTAPGCSVAELERAAQDLNDAARHGLQRRLKESRKRLKHGPPERMV